MMLNRIFLGVCVFLNMFIAACCGGAEKSSSGQYLFVQGSAGDKLSVAPFVRYYPDAEPVGDQCTYGCLYTLELLDAAGDVILSRPFGTDTLRVYTRNDEEVVSDSGMFGFSVPYSPQVKKLIVRKQGNIVHEQVRTPHPPVVKITEPENAGRVKGMIDVKWTSDDQDATGTLCQLDASRDGGENWSVFTPFVADRAFQVDAKYFYADNQDVVLRVVCSDGLNAGMDSIRVFIEPGQD